MKIKAGVFKAKCLQLMDQVNKNHTTIIITKYGKPVAKLVPYQNTKNESAPLPSGFGCMKDSVISYGDLVAPLEVKWDAEVE